MATLLSYWTLFSGNYAMEEYLRARVVPVPMGNDHIRFAWLLLVVYIFLIDEWMGKKVEGVGWNKSIIVFLIIYFAIYFHVLAAKTGLLGFYLVTVIALVKYGKRKYFLPAGRPCYVFRYWPGPWCLLFATALNLWSGITRIIPAEIIPKDYLMRPGFCHSKQEGRSCRIIRFWGQAPAMYCTTRKNGMPPMLIT